ncbi:hypothetical protein UFOVP618_57, partial [uncultured Caudovirales phage]
MKITTTKIIRELEKKGYDKAYLVKSVDEHLIKDIRDIIDEILTQQK